MCLANLVIDYHAFPGLRESTGDIYKDDRGRMAFDFNHIQLGMSQQIRALRIPP